MTATKTNGHYSTSKLAYDSTLHQEKESRLKKIAEKLPDMSTAHSNAERMIREHPKAAMLTGLATGFVVAILVRSLRR